MTKCIATTASASGATVEHSAHQLVAMPAANHTQITSTTTPAVVINSCCIISREVYCHRYTSTTQRWIASLIRLQRVRQCFQLSVRSGYHIGFYSGACPRLSPFARRTYTSPSVARPPRFTGERSAAVTRVRQCGSITSCRPVSYTHLTLPTNREV